MGVVGERDRAVARHIRFGDRVVDAIGVRGRSSGAVGSEADTAEAVVADRTRRTGGITDANRTERTVAGDRGGSTILVGDGVQHSVEIKRRAPLPAGAVNDPAEPLGRVTDDGIPHGCAIGDHSDGVSVGVTPRGGDSSGRIDGLGDGARVVNPSCDCLARSIRRRYGAVGVVGECGRQRAVRLDLRHPSETVAGNTSGDAIGRRRGRQHVVRVQCHRGLGAGNRDRSLPAASIVAVRLDAAARVGHRNQTAAHVVHECRRTDSRLDDAGEERSRVGECGRVEVGVDDRNEQAGRRIYSPHPVAGRHCPPAASLARQHIGDARRNLVLPIRETSEAHTSRTVGDDHITRRGIDRQPRQLQPRLSEAELTRLEPVKSVTTCDCEEIEVHQPGGIGDPSAETRESRRQFIEVALEPADRCQRGHAHHRRPVRLHPRHGGRGNAEAKAGDERRSEVVGRCRVDWCVVDGDLGVRSLAVGA